MPDISAKLEKLFPQLNTVLTGKIENTYLKPFTIDLQNVKKASLWSGIKLLLLIESLTDSKKYVKIIFPNNPRVRGFLKFIGLTGFLRFSSNHRPQGRYLSFCLRDSEPVSSDEEEYKLGVKIFQIMSTSMFMRYFRTDDGEFHAQLDINTIREWLNGIEEYRHFPLIRDGEFISFFGLQLVKNVEEHANVKYLQETGTSGFLSMRLVDNKSNYYFDYRLLPTLKRAENVLEVCIGDRGSGIINTLCKVYREKSIEYGFGNDITDDIGKNVLSFSVHELGTSKAPEKRVGSIHALHRILRSLAKYGGAIRISSGGYDMIYDLNPKTEILNRYTDRLGIQPTYFNKIAYAPGTQIQILVPLTLKEEKVCKIYPLPPVDELFENNHIIPVATYFGRKQLTEKEAQKKLAVTTDRLSHIGLNQLIVYDFLGKEWQYEDIVKFFGTQADILSRKRCIAIGIPNGIVEQISASERAFHDIIKGNPEAINKDFFLTLCDKQRILPILTIEQEVVFLGFGGNVEAERKFIKLFLHPESVELAHENSPLEIFYKSNEDLLSKNEGNYCCRLNQNKLAKARSESIKDNINTILEQTRAWQREGLYRLPTSNKLAGEFLWTLPVLENLTFNRQIGKWLAEGVRQKFKNNPPKELLMLCVTAPAEMVARSIVKELIDIKHYIINLGHFGAMDDDGLLTDELLRLPFFIVSDLVRDGHCTKMILKFLHQRWETEDTPVEDWGKAQGLLSFLHLAEKQDYVETMQWVSHQEFNKFDLDSFFVANVEKKNIECKGDKYLIEPFSLKPFKVSTLQSNPDNESTLIKRLEMAEKAEVLRVGHWVAGKHHFKVTTCIPKIINSEILGGKILREIGELCVEKKINHLLIPFHSNIRHIISKLRQYVAIRTGRTLDSTYTVEARALTNSSFYISPKQLKSVIRKKAMQITDFIIRSSKGSPPDSLKLLILDDAIYSARTLETILRALIRKVKESYKSSQVPLFFPPVECVHYYAIIDRKGRAKGSLFEGIRKIELFDENSISTIQWLDEDIKNKNYPYFEFEFHNWIALDMPAQSKESCSHCKERQWLRHVKYTDEVNIKFIKADIDLRIEKLKPFGVESPNFIHIYKTSKFSDPINIMGRKYITLEGALWEIHTRRNRGCPYEELIKIFIDSENSDDEILEELKLEIGRMIFADWKKFTANWAHKGEFKKAIEPEIKHGTKLIRQILPVVGGAYAMPDIEGREELGWIFSFSAECLSTLSSEDDPEGEKADNLLLGLEMAWLYFEHKQRQNQQRDDKIDVLKSIIISKIKAPTTASTFTLVACNELKRFVNHNTQRPFIPSLLFLMDHTIRAIRHDHAHLIPCLLSRLIKSRSHSGYQASKPFKKRDIDYFGKMLSFFAESLEIACQQESAFQKEIQAEFAVTVKRCKQLAKEFQTWKGWGKDTKKDKNILLRTNMLAHIFPNTGADIVTALEERLATTNDIFQALKEKCQKNGQLSFFSDKNTIESKTHCIVPNKEIIVAFLNNYLDERVIKKQDDCKALINIVEEPQHIVLSLHTNFECPDPMNDPKKGHGMGEAGTLPFALYDIKRPSIEPEQGYRFAVALKMWKGFKARR